MIRRSYRLIGETKLLFPQRVGRRLRSPVTKFWYTCFTVHTSNTIGGPPFSQHHTITALNSCSQCQSKYVVCISLIRAVLKFAYRSNCSSTDKSASCPNIASWQMRSAHGIARSVCDSLQTFYSYDMLSLCKATSALAVEDFVDSKIFQLSSYECDALYSLTYC